MYLDLGPGSVHGLRTAYQAVVTSNGGNKQDNKDAEDEEECFIHTMMGYG